MVTAADWAEMAARMPAWLRGLRAKAMLRCYAKLGIVEETCPACRGEGYMGADPLDRCPVCNGFGEVPEAVASWARERAFMQALRAGTLTEDQVRRGWRIGTRTGAPCAPSARGSALMRRRA